MTSPNNKSTGLMQLTEKFSKFTEKTNPKMDQIKKSILSDLDNLKSETNLNDLVKNFYQSAESGFKTDLDEINIRGQAQEEYLLTFKRNWAERNMQSRTVEILESPELVAMDAFITDIENLPKLAAASKTAKPMSVWESMLKGYASKIPGLDKLVDKFFGPVLSALGLGMFLSEETQAKLKATKDKKEGKNKEAATENKEVLKKPGSTLFLGDSLTVGIADKSKDTLNIEGEIKTVAKEGMSSGWGLKQAKELANQKPSPLKNMENAVILFGTNDILNNPENIINNLKETYKTLKEAGVKNIYAVTIPPFKGYKKYDKEPKANENRKKVNEWIRKTTEEGLSHHVIDLCKTQNEGGLADNNNSEALADGTHGKDNLHIKKEALAKIYQQELVKGANKKES